MTSPAIEPLDDRLFTLTVTRLADSLGSGGDPSPYRGAGIDFSQCRPYVPGDSIKLIDWRVTARTGKLHIREYESLKNMPVLALLDRSASMRMSLFVMRKIDWALAITGALGLVAIRRSSPFGMYCSGATHPALEFQPSLSTDRLYERLHLIHRTAPADGDPTQVGVAADRLSASLRERSLILVISDLYETDLVDKLKRISERHETLVLRLRDPAEAQPPRFGFMIGREAETGRRFSLFRRNKKWPVDDRRSQLLSAGIPTIDLRTDQDFVPSLRQFLANRLPSIGGER